ncbi:PA0069 family radical SAM protein [Kushneria phosphatilytica]|uniref:PA0069 family radical SAM protein n=1 Tax=Kushneria phosphatilytica TaxID=657387 RepID=A0A1S1NWJ1_9GAMM|nr:PA0069 family radical SAM protein [Kushneria phosphatilytica]OHV08658.1 radical SAM protein [Kushneria phosphatilytica]QEL12372.1 PA0069 family radical SAM protein [Kushneria phosphatilytica]
MCASPIRGRGASHNPHHRFEQIQVEAVDDGWWQDDTEPTHATEVRLEQSRSAISRNNSPDMPFERSLNPYRGCEHGCIYCFARPSHAWWDLSPGLDFETRLIARTNLVEQLTRELQHPGYQCQPICIGANTDPYQPIEREHRLTRGALEVLLTHRHPATVTTRSTLILRDLDLLTRLAEQRLVRVFISFTTLDRELKRIMEPRAASPQGRLRIIKTLNEHGVPVGIITAPMIPMINDMELERLLEAGCNAGATSAGYTFLRLPHEVRPLFEHWLSEHFPERAEHVMSLIRQSRGGRDYDSRFGHRLRGEGPFAELLAQRFRLAIRRLGLNRRRQEHALDCSQFSPPGQQIDLF